MTLPGSVKRSSSDLLTSFLSDPDASPPEGWVRPTGLYRFFDEQERLLYVGITSRLRIRMTEHARDYAETWWPLVASRSVEWYQTRSEAGRAERTAITTEKPPYNVLHTPRHCVPVKSRHRDYGQRGMPLLRLAQEHFDLEPFTATDALYASRCSKAAVQKWIRALTQNGRLVRVGTRYCASKHKGVPIREQALYAVPDSAAARSGQPVHQWVDVSKTTRPPGPRQGSSGGGNRWNVRYPGGREQSLMEAATRAFGDQPFTYGQLAEAVGVDVPSIAVYLRKLKGAGRLIPAGRAEHPQGRRGYPPAIYVVATAGVTS
ncbi:GIY-YIG nuclease family protein [Streptomyces sp. NPDC047939]|uniref:GIY-YIG nuclease family protein n=1 Tax=Streptomyces sp. NPDC047939 TaxID=3155381 RepID=UPI0034260819